MSAALIVDDEEMAIFTVSIDSDERSIINVNLVRREDNDSPHPRLEAYVAALLAFGFRMESDAAFREDLIETGRNLLQAQQSRMKGTMQ